MANIQQVSFDMPLDLESEHRKIDRSRKMAEMLQQQAMQPGQQGQMVSGHYVAPSPISSLAKILEGYAAHKGMEAADKQDADLGQKSNQMLSDGLQRYQRTLQGTPEQDAPNDASGDEITTKAAVPGNRQAALAQLLQSGHPLLQKMGAQQMLAKQESPFSKVDPKDFTQDSVSKFAQTQNFADLVPARKMEVGPNGVAYNPYGVKEGAVFNDPNKLVSIGPDGQPIINQQLVSAKKDIARSGASNVQVKTDVKTGESLAGQVGPMMKDSTAIAEGAVKQVDAANRVVSAIDSGNVIAGPGATLRMKGAQLSQMLGIGGKDEAEKIANTRTAIRGFAELTLQGRQQMRGQGAITESEGKLAEKAMSGNIDDLTPAEIKQLAKASERSARFNYAEHQRKLKVMESNPSLQGIAPFYQGPAMPAEAVPAAPGAPAQQGGIKFMGFE